MRVASGGRRRAATCGELLYLPEMLVHQGPRTQRAATTAATCQRQRTVLNHQLYHRAVNGCVDSATEPSQLQGVLGVQHTASHATQCPGHGPHFQRRVGLVNYNNLLCGWVLCSLRGLCCSACHRFSIHRLLKITADLPRNHEVGSQAVVQLSCVPVYQASPCVCLLWRLDVVRG
jgi:hypothetical protein